jgi:hypothetical protein
VLIQKVKKKESCDTKDFITHSVFYASIEVCHHIVAESHIFLNAPHTAVAQLLRTALIYCPATHYSQLRVPHPDFEELLHHQTSHSYHPIHHNSSHQPQGTTSTTKF